MKYHGLLPNQGPAQHHYSHVPQHQKAATGSDDCCGLFDEQPEERFVFVGECGGHYEESMRGNFHYVGPNQGHFEKQLLPPKRKWQRCVYVSCVLLVFVAVCATVAWYTFFAPAPVFDCFAGLENSAAGWSDMKKEYCCENEGVGCKSDGSGFIPHVETEPVWLQHWLGDFSLGIKFTVSATIMLIVGCCCGAAMYNQYLLRCGTRRRSPTEVELEMEIKRLLRRLGGKPGEIGVTMMWDTVDDLDLHLRLPTGEVISADNPQASGGKLCVDGNHTLQMANMKPIESISWPEYDEHERNHPPEGEYTVCVKVYARFQQIKDPNITICLNVSGEQELFHQQITACCCEVKVCSFVYTAPCDDRHGRHPPRR